MFADALWKPADQRDDRVLDLVDQLATDVNAIRSALGVLEQKGDAS